MAERKRCGIRKNVKKQALEKEVKIREVGEGESWSVNEAEFSY
ncbi:Late competence protein ComEC, DNA transport [Bacillus cereus]|nr:Late competence protein ComEC, DNA transport [Bacillus cereus]